MNANYNWRFGSVSCWGEEAIGNWTLQVTDKRQGVDGTWTSWTLAVYGHPKASS